jgi:aminopeptidase N
LRPHHIGIGLYDRLDGSLSRTYSTEVDVAGPATFVPGLIGKLQPDLILLNDGDLGYALVRFDERSLRTLTSSISELADPLARVVCWTALLDMAEQAELSLPRLVQLLSGGMGSESAVTMVQWLQGRAQELMQVLGDPAWVPSGKTALAAAGAALLRAADAGSDKQLAWAQLLGWTATTEAQLDLLAGLLDGTVVLPGLVVDADLRWSLLRRLASTGRAGDAEIAAELDRDATDAGQRNAQGCRAAIPDAAHKAEAWRLLTQDAALSVERVLEVGRGFNQAEHARLLAPYAERYFEALPAMFAGRSAQIALLLGRILFPYSAASPSLVERIEAVLASGERAPGLDRLLTERRDVVQRALRSRGLAG